MELLSDLNYISACAEDVSIPEAFIEDDQIADYIQLGAIRDIIDRSTKTVTDEAYPFLKQYPVGSEQEGEVASIQPDGIFVEFGLTGVGMVHVSTLRGVQPGDFDHGDRVKVVIEGYKTEHHKFDLLFIGRIDPATGPIG